MVGAAHTRVWEGQGDFFQWWFWFIPVTNNCENEAMLSILACLFCWSFVGFFSSHKFWCYSHWKIVFLFSSGMCAINMLNRGLSIGVPSSSNIFHTSLLKCPVSNSTSWYGIKSLGSPIWDTTDLNQSFYEMTSQWTTVSYVLLRSVFHCSVKLPTGDSSTIQAKRSRVYNAVHWKEGINQL